MDAVDLVVSLAPTHALHGAFEEVPADVGKRVMCSCGADLTFSPMAIATLLILDRPVELPAPTVVPQFGKRGEVDR